jgi:predicted DNA-binding transcriptional regulator AlpA
MAALDLRADLGVVPQERRVTLHAVPTETRYITREQDELLTRPEMASRMRVSLPTFDRMRYEGTRMGFPMPVVTWGHRRIVLFRPRDVEAWGAEYERRRAA